MNRVHQRFGVESGEEEHHNENERPEREEGSSSNLRNLVGVVRRAWNRL